MNATQTRPARLPHVGDRITVNHMPLIIAAIATSETQARRTARTMGLPWTYDADSGRWLIVKKPEI